MLLVRTRLSLSDVHGIGCFAVQTIPKGTPVWRFTRGVDNFLTTKMAEAIDQEFIDRFTQQCEQTGDYLVCGDNARFINHSDTPNITSNVPLCDPDVVDYALRDIACGEEILQDYRIGDARPWSGFAEAAE